MIVFFRWRAAADNPVEQIRIGAIEQSFETLQLRAVQVSDMGLGKSAEYEVALLRSAMPAAEQDLLRRIWACWFDNRSAALPNSLMMTFPAYCTDIGIMLLLRLAMIQIEPVMTRKTISTPKARARILFV